jgi:hypothetical protein
MPEGASLLFVDVLTVAVVIDNPVDPSPYIVGNIGRAAGSHRQATWTMFGPGG